MSLKEIAVLTSEKSWFAPYAKRLTRILKDKGYKSKLFHKYEDIGKDFGVVFILSYFKIIKARLLKEHTYNLIVHESDLPKGRGGSPLFWQILEGKNKMPIVLFEAIGEMDAGKIYFKDHITLSGTELHDEIRHEQAVKTIGLCLRFLRRVNKLKAKRQRGKPTYYRMRNHMDSKLDIRRSIKDQFELLRIVNNRDFPAFFDYKGHRYILKIFKR